MNGYEVKVTATSRELTKKEIVSLKNTDSCVRLDEATQNGQVVITPSGYAILAVHNERSDDKDYTQYIIFDENGTKYLTGSKSFFEAFTDIYVDMTDENGKAVEPYQVEAKRVPSKNYKGKSYLTCTII